jgi:hypothetical protein
MNKISLNKKHIKLFVVLLVIASVIISMIPYTYSFDTNVTALMINNYDTEEALINIRINGRYTKRFLRNDKFEGNIVIENFNLTNRHNNLVSIDIRNNTYSFLDYRRWESDRLITAPFGVIFASKYFRRFIIVPYSQYTDNLQHDGNDGGSLNFFEDKVYIIIYPAKTRNDAVQVANNKLQPLLKDMEINFIFK